MPARRQLTDADRVWNRASYGEGTDFADGDHALAAVLLVDGYIQNGGVCHAFDLTAEELADGIAGFRFFGLGELATLIVKHDSKDESAFNRRYFQLVGEERRIWAAFVEMFQLHPQRFAPLLPE